jgi:hypothetical protein
VAQARKVRHLRQVDVGGCCDVLLVGDRVRGARHGQEVEDPAAAVVGAHDRQVDRGTAGGQQAAQVVQERELADQ